MDCIFCKIMNNEIPSYTIYEDDIVKVFLDINPHVSGHSLVVPKKHIKDIEDLDDITMEHIFKIAKKMKKVFEEKLNCDGLTLVQNNGISQEVKHYHLHLMPNYKEEVNYSVEETYKKLTD